MQRRPFDGWGPMRYGPAMPAYIFRAACRRPDGAIGLTLDQRPLTADDDGAAIAQARVLDLDLGAIGANAVYLAAPDGRVIWSLHVAGEPETER